MIWMKVAGSFYFTHEITFRALESDRDSEGPRLSESTVNHSRGEEC